MSKYFKPFNMLEKKIDWIKIKQDSYTKWRDLLYAETKQVLTSSIGTPLAQLNDIGFFHKVGKEEHLQKMIQDWNKFGKVRKDWIVKGYFPGIWTALFNQYNTFSISSGSIYFIRFYFKNNYFIFDGMNDDHKLLWELWKGKQDVNTWDNMLNEKKESLTQRLKVGFYMPFPYHKKFYEDHSFGAAIGYSDYISAVILLENAIESVVFLE